MGKHRRKREEEMKELNDRLRELENRLNNKKKSRHRTSDAYARYSSRSDSSGSRSRRSRSKRSRSRRSSPTPSYHSRSRSRRREYSDHSCEPRAERSSTSRDNDTPCHHTTPSLDKEADQEGVTASLPDALPPGIEELLGDEGVQPIKTPVELHNSLATRWSTIIVHGLNEETRKNIINKQETPKNCSLLNPPKLNEEVAAALSDSGVKRDSRIREQQITLGAAITSLGKVLNTLIANQDTTDQILTLSNAARLLCHIYHENCITRRSLILPGLNKEMKELMEQTPISEYLFGDKLQDKFNAIKAVRKSGQELKNMPARPPTRPKRNLNYRGPHRQQFPRPGGQKILLKRNKPPATRQRHSPQRRQQRRRGQERH
ncbi:hypothetical protein HW555_004044 [Spodoptera exigua]|uniref:Uncharacterized protein n=1 Tax=Spodoptera exigua TaxID=7107 RepID=A0A835GJV7_SPOEX|nr:hypothetical protein HW555_004044 [Spodoptera exigua]